MGARASLDVLEKRKMFFLCRDSSPGCPTRSLVAILTTKHQLSSTRINYEKL
jgi:hypothetical protein